MAGRLNDNEVAKEMDKMVQFIKQEAFEKAKEIKVKADEEFNIEKAKLVRQETLAIEAFYQKKMKQAEVQKRMYVPAKLHFFFLFLLMTFFKISAQSTHVNKSRLKILQARQAVLGTLFTDMRKRLQTISQDPAKYGGFLQNLILQCLFRLMDPLVTVQGRKQDIALLKAAIEGAKKEYIATFGSDVTIVLDESNPVPESSAGGVVVSSNDGRIRLDNTLEARLDILAETMLPEIRLELFGPSPNRKFFN
ncbi:ATP synthase subunit-domain-containing protein [Cladochytrium replicatum]|nr:ATP synthase subunit-domain-containing protein [Cladochytrium replicatum]